MTEPTNDEPTNDEPTADQPSPAEPAEAQEAAALEEPATPDEPEEAAALEEPATPDEPEEGEPDEAATPDEPEHGEPDEAATPEEPDTAAPPRRRGFSVTRLLTVLLLALLGFSFAVQARNVAADPELAALGQEDLVRILANLDAHEDRLREEIADLEESKRRLTTAGESQQEARAEAERRADELGILAGTLPAHGPGLVVRFQGGPEAVPAARLLDAVQELRGAGAEAMQIESGNGAAVRVVASTYFADGDGGVVVDGTTFSSPYTLTAIGDPETLAPALNLPGGVVEKVHRGGGTVTMQDEPGGVEVTALRAPTALEHARPVS